MTRTHPDHSKLAGRYWPTRQQLIVVTGQPEQVHQWLEALRVQQEAARDVIDLWDDQAKDGLLSDAVETLRATTHNLRQWVVGT